MKKLFYRTSFLFFLLFSLFLGGIQIYASTVLDSNIVALFQVIFDKSKAEFEETITHETKDIVTNKESKLNSIIDSSSKKVIDNVELFIEDEVKRAEQEIDAYVLELDSQLDGLMKVNEAELKKYVTNQMDEKITLMKHEIRINFYMALENYILDQLVE